METAKGESPEADMPHKSTGKPHFLMWCSILSLRSEDSFIFTIELTLYETNAL